jgi:hypothetical protein
MDSDRASTRAERSYDIAEARFSATSSVKASGKPARRRATSRVSLSRPPTPRARPQPSEAGLGGNASLSCGQLLEARSRCSPTRWSKTMTGLGLGCSGFLEKSEIDRSVTLAVRLTRRAEMSLAKIGDSVCARNVTRPLAEQLQSERFPPVSLAGFPERRPPVSHSRLTDHHDRTLGHEPWFELSLR